MSKLSLKISLFDLFIRKGRFTINVLKIGLVENRYIFRLFGIEKGANYIQLQMLGVPIIIKLRGAF